VCISGTPQDTGVIDLRQLGIAARGPGLELSFFGERLKPRQFAGLATFDLRSAFSLKTFLLLF
jgi:hypothetical protein